jgi:UDP:flavonoid glycosyltransferase YjiC (YdhE family)
VAQADRCSHRHVAFAPAVKVLFIAEAVTLAHVGRALRLATWLHEDGAEVILACDPRERRFLAGAPFPVRAIRSIASAAFLEALARGRAVYDEATLADYARDDLALLQDVAPDAVVGDFRLSLSASARHAGVPYVNVTKAYWSPYARPRFRMPSLPGTRHLPSSLGDALFRAVRPLAFALHARPINRLRRAYGLAPLPPDVRHAYCDGDLTLYADLPQMVPLIAAPASHRHIGPVIWSPPIASPPWWDEVMAGEASIYVTLGSSGPATRLPEVVAALCPLGRPIVVATAGRGDARPAPGDAMPSRGDETPRRGRATFGREHATKTHHDGMAGDPPGNGPPAAGPAAPVATIHVADYVDGDAIAAKACLVVCNGGSPTTQQALAHGVPVIGIASNLDQMLNMAYVERTGAGVLLDQRRTGCTLTTLAELASGEGTMRAAAARIAAMMAAGSARCAFAASMCELLQVGALREIG